MKHPYPKHVVEAVAKAVFEYYDRSDGLDVSASETARVALTALWEASRVDTREELERLHDHALIVDVDGYWFQKDEYAEPEDEDNGSWPMHAVYYWGDAE